MPLPVKAFLVFTLFLLVHPAQAQAYTCWGKPDPLLTMEDATAVFTGKVLANTVTRRSVLSYADTRVTKVDFVLTRIWKGIPKNQATVAAYVEAIYEYRFDPEEEYLVYAYDLQGNGLLSMVGCPRNRKAADAEIDILTLGPAEEKDKNEVRKLMASYRKAGGLPTPDADVIFAVQPDTKAQSPAKKRKKRSKRGKRAKAKERAAKEAANKAASKKKRRNKKKSSAKKKRGAEAKTEAKTKAPAKKKRKRRGKRKPVVSPSPSPATTPTDDLPALPELK